MPKMILRALIGLLLLCTFAASAGPLSDYLEGELIKYWFQNGTVAAKPATVFVGLSTTACSDTGFGTEVSGGAYARVAMTNNTTNWPGPTSNNGTVSNGIVVTFPAATANWGTVTHFHISDASTAGNPMVCEALTNARNITTGATPSFPIGSLTVQFDN